VKRHTVLVFALVILLHTTGMGAVRIATANLEDFGFGGGDCKGAYGISQIAAILSTYDIVSCQEVMRASDNGQRCYGCTGYSCQLGLLVAEMSRISGQTWSYRVSGPHRYASRYEYYAFLYNTSTVTYLGMEGTAAGVPGSPIFEVRPPFWAYFRSGTFDFVLVDYHAPSVGSSVSTYAEVQKLESFLDALQTSDPDEQDYILAGDINQTYLQLDHFSCACKATLDYLIFDQEFTGYEWDPPLCFTDTALEDQGLSDHPIVWAQFDTTKEDDD
jgi:hypothetical protein